MPLESSVGDATIWSINYTPRVVNWALRFINIALIEHL